MTKAFQNGEASKVAPFKYVEVVFTLALVYFGLVKSILVKAFWELPW